MVKVNAPCLSLAASGKLGGAIVYSIWRGRPVVRTLVTPANPQSAMQTGIRAMFAFLSQNWVGLSSGQQADWQDRADSLVASPFNGYMSYNMSRWRSFLAPSKLDPAAEDDAVGTGVAWSPTGGVRQVTIGYQIANLNQNWGLIYFRSPTALFTPSLSNVIAIVLGDDTNAHTYVDSPLTAGTYYYDCMRFSDAGLLHTADGEQSAVVSDV